MQKPFIRNHQYNLIKKQARLVQNALRTVSDRNVIQSVREGAEYTIAEQFREPEQRERVQGISLLETSEQLEAYLRELELYLLEFPELTEIQIRKLFPKNKKLKVPDLKQMDRRYMSYLSWMDIATNKLFMVYPVDGQFVGLEGRYTPINKQGYCFICNKQEELALFSALSKKRPEKSSPDYYKTVGNYLCTDSQACNENMTDLSALERFIASVMA
ncbi:FusB/FusC family EF-G-binding protein [Cohnella mopanensis]|uniref:FusB/FusC family EF-G-binding protein n=1 Tax=Cohnella mopanensis TaxID=2911966 RepID=UPI001EF8D23B|nr:FusB/FusC family EF-G-binding protein [Cohnella mopanensis]